MLKCKLMRRPHKGPFHKSCSVGSISTFATTFFSLFFSSLSLPGIEPATYLSLVGGLKSNTLATN